MLGCIGADEAPRRNRHVAPLEVDPAVVHAAIRLVHFAEGMTEAACRGPVPMMIQEAVSQLVGDETDQHGPRNLVTATLAHDVALLDLDDLAVARIDPRDAGPQEDPVPPITNA